MITEKQLIQAGFERYDVDDEVEMRETGSNFYFFEKEYPELNRSLSVGFKNEKYIYSSILTMDGDIIEDVEADNILKTSLHFFWQQSEIKKILSTKIQ